MNTTSDGQGQTRSTVPVAVSSQEAGAIKLGEIGRRRRRIGARFQQEAAKRAKRDQDTDRKRLTNPASQELTREQYLKSHERQIVTMEPYGPDEYREEETTVRIRSTLVDQLRQKGELWCEANEDREPMRCLAAQMLMDLYARTEIRVKGTLGQFLPSTGGEADIDAIIANRVSARREYKERMDDVPKRRRSLVQTCCVTGALELKPSDLTSSQVHQLAMGLDELIDSFGITEKHLG